MFDSKVPLSNFLVDGPVPTPNFLIDGKVLSPNFLKNGTDRHIVTSILVPNMLQWLENFADNI